MEATNKNDNDKVTMSGATFNEMKRRFDEYNIIKEKIEFISNNLTNTLTLGYKRESIPAKLRAQYIIAPEAIAELHNILRRLKTA
jgi:uncharacterized protein YydD (DUF2326 family)